MGLVRHVQLGTTYPLAARTLVGRAAQCVVRLDDEFVSREHATIEYVDGRYYVKDLSSNGTSVGGSVVERGELSAFKPGQRLALGHGKDGPVLELLDPQPPRLVAHELESGYVVSSPSGSLLRLPDGDDDPSASTCAELGCDDRLGPFLFRDRCSDRVESIENEQVVRVGARLWMVHLPVDGGRTAQTIDGPVDLSNCTLRLITDESHEQVEVRVSQHGPQLQGMCNRERTVVSRSRYAQTLLTLALRKSQDLKQGVPRHNAGWLSNDELRGLLGCRPGRDDNLPYLHPFRLKRLFEGANVRGLAQLFERDQGLLRLGLNDFEVVVDGAP